jgi:hypothetical protein
MTWKKQKQTKTKNVENHAGGLSKLKYDCFMYAGCWSYMSKALNLTNSNRHKECYHTLHFI